MFESCQPHFPCKASDSSTLNSGTPAQLTGRPGHCCRRVGVTAALNFQGPQGRTSRYAAYRISEVGNAGHAQLCTVPWLAHLEGETMRRADLLEHKLKAAEEAYNRELLKLDAAGEAVRVMIQCHPPCVIGPIDVSISTTDELREDLAEKVGRYVPCASCQTPWPCKPLIQLRLLRQALASGQIVTGELQAMIPETSPSKAIIPTHM